MILMIDEEKRRLLATVEYLEECGYNVTFIDNIDFADIYIRDNVLNIKAIILDIMMPWGNIFTADQTKYGLYTGQCFLKRIREQHSYKGPVVIYTAHNSQALLNSLKKESNCTVVLKGNDMISTIISSLNQFGVYPGTKI